MIRWLVRNVQVIEVGLYAMAVVGALGVAYS